MESSFALGVFVGASITGAAATLVLWVLLWHEKWLRAQWRAADERLYAAWKDGYQIPATEPEKAQPEEPLPEALEEWVADFDEAGQAVWRAKARALFAGGKLSPDLIIRQLERQRGLPPDEWPQ